MCFNIIYTEQEKDTLTFLSIRYSVLFIEYLSEDTIL